MSQPNKPAPVPPSPAALLAGYLQRQQEAHAAGLAAFDLGGEVVPYEAGPVQPIEARPAWEEATAAMRFLAPAQPAKGWQAPPHWPALVAAHEPAAALAFSLGNFPQLVRDLQLLLHADRLRELRPAAGRPASVPALLDWTADVAGKKRFPELLLAVGSLRLAKQLDRAAEIVQSRDADVPPQWRPAWDNECAALAWHSGREEEARALWLAQSPSVPVLFNRGMSALFLDRPDEARPALQEVASQIPETSAWHHLAQLYLALAANRI
jgi:hypothetical protein